MKAGDILAKRYQIVELLGRGAMGEVYLARDQTLDREVALKLLRPQVLGRGQAAQRFRREAELLAEVRHPHLVQLLDADFSGPRPFLVLEVLKGVDLEVRFREGVRFELPKLLALAQEVGEALDTLHGLGILHRDLKPANLIERDRGGFVVTDLGLARGDQSDLTRTGEVVGTPRYFPPELVRGQEITPASDLFQLGLILFEAATGLRRIPGETLTEVAMALSQDRLEPFPEDCSLPDFVQGAIEKATRIRPEDRFPSGAALARALAGESASLPPSQGGRSRPQAPKESPASRPGQAPLPPKRRGGRRPRVPFWVPSLGALGLALGLGYWGSGWSQPEGIQLQVVGDAALVSARLNSARGARLEVRGPGAPEGPILPQAGQGGPRSHFLVRGLSRENPWQVRLAWDQGADAWAEVRAELPLFEVDPVPGPEGQFRVRTRRPVTCWDASGREVPSAIGPGLWTPESTETGWRLRWRELGVEFSRDFARVPTLLRLFHALAGELSRARQEPPQAIPRAISKAWEEALSWLPEVWKAEDPRLFDLVWELLRVSDRHSSIEFWSQRSIDSPGARDQPKEAPEGESLALYSPSYEPDGEGRYPLFANSNREFNVELYGVPKPIETRWLPPPSDSIWVAAKLSDFSTEAVLRVVPVGDFEPRQVVELVPPRESEAGRFSGWVRVRVPRRYAPSPNQPCRIEIAPRFEDRRAGFVQGHLVALRLAPAGSSP